MDKNQPFLFIVCDGQIISKHEDQHQSTLNTQLPQFSCYHFFFHIPHSTRSDMRFGRKKNVARIPIQIEINLAVAER